MVKDDDRAATGTVRTSQLLLIGAVVVPLLLLVIGSFIAYRATLAGAKAALQRDVSVAEEHTIKVLETSELAAARIGDLVSGLDDDAVRRRELPLHDQIVAEIKRLPQIENVWVVSRTGRALVTGHEYPADATVDLSDRDYFRSLQDSATPFVSPIRIGQFGGEPHFVIARRRADAAAGFDGVVAVAVPPAYFQSFYDTLLGSRAYTAAVFRTDGAALVRYHASAHSGVTAGAGALLMHALAGNPNGGIAEGYSAISGSERVVAYKKLAGYPIIVSVGRSRASILREWRQYMLPYLYFGVPATLALVLLSLMALRGARREQAALVQAREAIRRRAAAEDALRQAQRMEAVGQLTGGIAHDFNNLLTAILGNFDFIESIAGPNERVKKLAAAGRRAAERGASLTASLLAFARRQRLATAMVDVNALMQDFVLLARRVVGAAAELELVLDPTIPHCRVDAAQLEAAVLNLVINARDAMAAGGGALTITTGTAALTAAELAGNSDAAPGRFVTIAVGDSGIGMTRETIARAFEPFFTTKEIGKGSGLGLSQVYGLLRQSAGHVAIESRLGQGTVVTLFLPPGDRAAAEPPGEPLPKVTALAAAAVLIVEDDPDVLEITRRTLHAAGFRVLAAADADAALAVLDGSEKVDLLFSDVVMPNGMSGVELARRARALRPGLRVLLTSGYPGATSAASEFELIDKPYRNNELAARIRTAIGAANADPALRSG